MTGGDHPDYSIQLAVPSRAVPGAFANFMASACLVKNTLALQGSAG
jgi:hypothetical protein